LSEGKDVRELSEAASKQGELWGRAARDWAAIQEPGTIPLWNAVLDSARVGAGTRILDAGCGAGGACVIAVHRGADVFGADPSVNLVTIARKRLPHCDFRIGELENLPFSNGCFDAVIAVNSLQYVSNPKLAMHELGRVSRQDGRVVVAVFADPERCDAVTIFRAIVDLFPKPPSSGGPFSLSAPDALRLLVETVVGLRVETIEELDLAHEYPDLETALRGQMSAGATWRAVEILGEDRVRAAIRGVLERFDQGDGTVRMMNRFRYAVAVKT
jgi:SAM-dependent methyltransferase